MTRGCDEQKRREWELRFARYRASGLTVAKFCESEAVATHTFYYWSRRIPAAAQARSPSSEASGQRTGRGRVAARPPRALAERREAGSVAVGPPQTLTPEHARMVYFELTSGTRISVPADCLDALRCVAHFVEQDLAQSSPAFQQVLVGNR